MDIEKEALFDSLLHWICSLDIPSGQPTEESLVTGRSIAEALHIIDRSFFDESWLEKIPSYDATSNWRVKANNLRKIHTKLVDFYEEVLHRPLPADWQPDVSLIAEHSHKGALSHMLQLVLGAAVFGPLKNEFVQGILSLDESIQTSIMMAVRELSVRAPEPPSVPDARNQVNDQSPRDREELDRLREECTELRRRCYNLDQQVAVLQEEKQTQVTENQKLSERLNRLGDDSFGLDDPDSPASQRVKQLTQQVDRLSEDLYRTEAEKEDFKHQNEALLSEVNELKLRVEELAPLESEYRQMKDEADELRSKAAEAKKIETTLETYRNKIKEHADLKIELKVLQDKNANYMKSVIDLEEEQRKNATLKTQVEAYKRSTLELETKLGAEIKRADKYEYDVKRLTEKLEASNCERERLLGEREQWKELAAEHNAYHENNGNDSSNEDMLGMPGMATDSLAATMTPSELKERLLRLQTENDMLRERSSKSDEVELLQEQLETTRSRKAELETEVRLAHQKTLELEARIEDLQAEAERGLGGADARLAAKHQEAEELKVRIEQLGQQLIDANKHINERESAQGDSTAVLEAKDSELRAAQAKLKTYMEKARTVIVSLEEQSKVMDGGTELSRHEFDSLRREIEMKDKRIQRLEEGLEKNRIMQEQEQRLITTAFYGMGMQVHKNSVDQKGSAVKSFLTKQREIVTPRPQPQTQAGTALR
uniref:Protein hook n=1 Tax=Plectus sambesii TaxID=2011161 RepID=A0A914WZQ2_9BILA